MLPDTKIEGKSLPLNATAIVLNLAGLYLLAYDFLYGLDTINLVIGYVMFFLGLAGIVSLSGLFMFSYAARSLVGGLFIVSGLIKANDPMGFGYKLEEYFAESALNMPYFQDYVVPISIFICVAEILLGAALILGAKIKLTSWALLLMTGFFLWLTYYTASCNDAMRLALQNGEEFSRMCVTDCGCFGDAFRGSFGRPLTPWESFTKDIVLMYLVLIVFFNQWKIRINTVNENFTMISSSLIVISFFCWVFSWWFPLLFAAIALFGALLFGNAIRIKFIDRSWTMGIFVFLLSFLFSMYTVNYLPVRDYRPYAVGNNLVEQMNNGQPAIVKKEFLTYDLHSAKKVKMSVIDYIESDEKDNYVLKEEFNASAFEKSFAVNKDSTSADTIELKGYLKGQEWKEYKMASDSVSQSINQQVLTLLDLRTADSVSLSEEKYMKNKNWERYEVIEGSSKENVIKEGIPTSIQDFVPQIPYDKLPDSYKNNQLLDSIYKADKSEYYRDIAIVKYIGDPQNSYTDTVPLNSYSDTLYPDTSFKVLGKGSYLRDPDKPYKIDMTDFILEQEQLVLIVMRKLDMARVSSLGQVSTLIKGLRDKDIPVFVLSSSSREKIASFKEKYELPVPFLSMDDIEAKIIIRSNPGVVSVSNAVVQGKWPGRRVPSLDDVIEGFEN